MEDGPEDLLAKMDIVAVEVLVRAPDSQHIVLRGQQVIYVIFLLSPFQGIVGMPSVPTQV